MALKLTNNAVSSLAAAIEPGTTVIPIQAADAGRFPALVEGDWFPLVIKDEGGNEEYMKATARAGSNITVDRAQEGSTAKAFALGARVDLRLTVAAINAIYNTAAQAVSIEGDSTKTGRLVVGGVAATDAQGADPAQLTIQNAAGVADNVAALGLTCQGDFSTKIYLKPEGVLGFGGGSTAPDRAYLDLATGVFTAADVGIYSDPRLKENVELIGDALSIVRALDGVRFTWGRNSHLIGRPGMADIGILADQVEAVLPELVGLSVADDHGEQWRTVAYQKLVAVLIEAVKALDKRISAMEREAV